MICRVEELASQAFRVLLARLVNGEAATHDALAMASLVRKITAPLQAPERSDSRGDPDRLRTGLIRYAGYANEVGESFRPLVPRAAVNATYVAATGYVMADAAWRANTLPTDSPRSPMVEVVDTLIWQGLASIIVPGELIARDRKDSRAPRAAAKPL